MNNMYQVVIFQDRYHGTYSHGNWIAVHDVDVDTGFDDHKFDFMADDGSAMSFDYSKVGVGDTPNDALNDLLKKLEVNLNER